MGNSCITCSTKSKAIFTNTIPAGKPGFSSTTTTIDYKRITAKYKFSEEVLGAGNFGKVFLASSVADSEFKVAIKTL